MTCGIGSLQSTRQWEDHLLLFQRCPVPKRSLKTSFRLRCTFSSLWTSTRHSFILRFSNWGEHLTFVLLCVVVNKLVNQALTSDWFHMVGKSQVAGDFTVFRPFQSSPTNENSKSQTSSNIRDNRRQIGKIKTDFPMTGKSQMVGKHFPNRLRVLRRMKLRIVAIHECLKWSTTNRERLLFSDTSQNSAMTGDGYI